MSLGFKEGTFQSVHQRVEEAEVAAEVAICIAASGDYRSPSILWFEIAI